jgi:hypothetical protein
MHFSTPLMHEKSRNVQDDSLRGASDRIRYSPKSCRRAQSSFQDSSNGARKGWRGNGRRGGETGMSD